MVELLVSLGIIAIIALAFSMILSQSKAIVNTTQQLMRTNSAASAVAQVIRDDFVGLSKEGFLAISNDARGDHLVFTATGVFPEPTGVGTTANAAVIDYGRLPNAHILWRRALPLIPGANTGNPYTSPARNAIDGYLGLFRNNPAIVINNTLIGTYTSPHTALAGLTPPNYPVGMATELWPVLATECEDDPTKPKNSAFTVQWWDQNVATWKPNPTTPAPGLWTFADNTPASLNPWPKMVRVTFALRLGDKGGDVMNYEVICPIGD